MWEVFIVNWSQKRETAYRLRSRRLAGRLWCAWRCTACSRGMNQVAQEYTHSEERIDSADLSCSNPAHFQKKKISSFWPDSWLGPGRWALEIFHLVSIFVCVRKEATATSLITIYANSVVCGKHWFCSGDWSLISWGHLSGCCIPPDWP